MDIKDSLVRQYRASFKMLRQCIKLCPESSWEAGSHPRCFWRIAYHAIFYTHLYLMQRESDFVPWKKQRQTAADLWGDPERIAPYSKAEVLAYLKLVDQNLDEWMDALELEAETTGFSWYKGMNKLDHQIMNLRHLQGHVGQLSELLMAHGIETSWIGIVAKREG